MSDREQTPATELSRLECENAKLKEEILCLRICLDAMQTLMDAVEDGLDPMTILQTALDDALRMTKAQDGSVLIRNEETNELVFVLSQGAIPHEQLAWRGIPAGKGIAAWVVDNQRATIVNDPYADDRFFAILDNEFEFRTRSVLAAPIVGGGACLGVFELLNKQDQLLFSTGDQTLLSLLCRFMGELLSTLVKDAPPGDSSSE